MLSGTQAYSRRMKINKKLIKKNAEIFLLNKRYFYKEEKNKLNISTLKSRTKHYYIDLQNLVWKKKKVPNH